MPENAISYTLSEAGVISGLGRKAIDNAIDKKIIPAVAKPSVVPSGGKGAVRRRRQISETDLLWIYVNSRAPGAIPPAERAPLYQRFAADADAKSLRVSDLVIVDLAAARAEIEKRASALDLAKARIVNDPEVLGAEPVFEGTRVVVYDVAASVRAGIPRERILAAYSMLDEEAIDQAVLYAEAFPPRGRPRGTPRTRPALVLIEEKLVRRKRTE